MSIREYLVPLSLALLTVWGLQYFWTDHTGSSVQKPVAGETFVAPERELACKPLNKDVDFIDEKRGLAEESTEVNTKNARLTFSTNGGALQRLEFKREKLNYPITTVFPVGPNDREDVCFLVGLQEKTPYAYRLVKNVVRDNEHILTYQTETEDAVIEKAYTIYETTYKIDLELRVMPKGEQAIQPRIFYPAPIMPDLGKQDTISAVYTDKKENIKKTNRPQLNVQQGWLSPHMFGMDNRYFLHTMLDDPNGFAHRAYYKLSGQNKLFSILEGPSITEKTTWRLSFYFGPKEEHQLEMVDERLQQTLDYAGFFKPVASFLLYVLHIFYIYLGNYGLAILLLTIVIKLLLLPFTFKGEQSMKKRETFDKKLRHIQQKYKDSPQKLAQERAALLKKHGMPGLGGCLPLLLQLPIFYALNRVLATSITLYQAPFYLWITNLAAPDPYYVLPVVLVASMLLQAATADKSQRSALLIAALVFGAVTASLPSGLALYILANALLGTGEKMLARHVKT